MTSDDAQTTAMSNDLAPVDIASDGKAILALMPQQRRFVKALLSQGANKHAVRKAATEAGYNPGYGFELMRQDSIMAAIREEATKRLAGAALLGVTVMLDIAMDPTHKDQFRAAKELMGINGFTAEQRIVVEHISPQGREIIQQVRAMAEQLGLDPRLLIEQTGVIIDADFEVMSPDARAEVDDSDW